MEPTQGSPTNRRYFNSIDSFEFLDFSTRFSGSKTSYPHTLTMQTSFESHKILFSERHSLKKASNCDLLTNVVHVQRTEKKLSEYLVKDLSVFLQTKFGNTRFDFSDLYTPLTFQICTKIFTYINQFNDSICINYKLNCSLWTNCKCTEDAEIIHENILGQPLALGKNVKEIMMAEKIPAQFEISRYALRILQRYAEALRLQEDGYEMVIDDQPIKVPETIITDYKSEVAKAENCMIQ